ncbi:MAG: hypothetical protein ACRDH0_02045, partial [Actinomycetota bacterium]
MARIDDAASADLDSLTAFLTARQNVGSAARRVLVKGNGGVEAFSRLATHAPITPKVLEEEIGGWDDQRVWFTFPRASFSEMGSSQFAVLSSGARRPSWERGGTSFEDYTAKDRSQWIRELTERMSVEAMKVYHLTIQENGHSRRFVYEDRDQALTRLADAIAAGLDARL